jgi:cytochrome P450
MFVRMSQSAVTSLPTSKTPQLLGLLEYAFAPRRFAARNAKSLGRVYRVDGATGTLVITSDPDHVKRVFAASPDSFDTFSQYTLGGILGGQSVLVTAGETHRRQRKLLAPPLSGARLRAFSATMQEIADRHVAMLAVGRDFRALDLSTDFTLDVIVRTVFGVTEAAEAAHLSALLRAMVDAVPVIAVFQPRLQKAWFPPWARYLRASQRFDAWLRNMVAERRRRGDAHGEDVMSLLLHTRAEDASPLEFDELRDQLVTLLLAGHETTSIALASCLEHIHRHPAVLDQLRDELGRGPSDPEEAQRSPYLGAVIDETLRIAPILSDVTRRVRGEFWLDEHLRLSDNDGVMVLIEALHHDPELYPEPAQFRPERFLQRKFAAYEYVPFGGGVRRCLGAAFSDYETRILLSTILRRVSLQLRRARPDPRVRRNITLGPKHGVPMRVVDARR